MYYKHSRYFFKEKIMIWAMYWSVQVIFHVVKYAYILKIYALSIECYSLHSKRHRIFFFHPRVIFGVRWKLFPFNYLIFEIIMKVKGVMHSSFFIISAIIIHRWISKLKRFWWGRFLCKDDWLLLLAGQERSWCLLHTKK